MVECVHAGLSEGAKTIETTKNPWRKYSAQQKYSLKPGDAVLFTAPDGGQRRIKLLSVRKSRDDVLGMVRSAVVTFSVDGVKTDVVFNPYAMPTVSQGLCFKVDSVSDGKDDAVELCVWGKNQKVVDLDKFMFPLPDYDMFSLPTHSFFEPGFLGWNDAYPNGENEYHMGVDFGAGDERQKVVFAIDAMVVERNDGLGRVVFEDENGFKMIYDHLFSIAPGVVVGKNVKRGDFVGIVGKKGAGGNFSHLHVGAYLKCRESEDPFNLYPWLVEAATADKEIVALARPNKIMLQGQNVLLGGLVLGNALAAYECGWILPDGSCISGKDARLSINTPGVFCAQFWAKDAQGHYDTDFCVLKVFPANSSGFVFPVIYINRTPARTLRVGEEFVIRVWAQGCFDSPSIRMDFGNGMVVDNFIPYKEHVFAYTKPGMKTITASLVFNGFKVEQKIKVPVI